MRMRRTVALAIANEDLRAQVRMLVAYSNGYRSMTVADVEQIAEHMAKFELHCVVTDSLSEGELLELKQADDKVKLIKIRSTTGIDLDVTSAADVVLIQGKAFAGELKVALGILPPTNRGRKCVQQTHPAQRPQRCERSSAPAPLAAEDAEKDAKRMCVKLGYYRRRLLLSRAVVAGRMGANPQSLLRWEQGLTMPSLTQYLAWKREIEDLLAKARAKASAEQEVGRG